MKYALTLPIAGIVCLVRLPFGKTALRLSGVYLGSRTSRGTHAMPQILKLGFFEHWTGGGRASSSTSPMRLGLPMSQGMWL